MQLKIIPFVITRVTGTSCCIFVIDFAFFTISTAVFPATAAHKNNDVAKLVVFYDAGCISTSEFREK